ncbi:MAG TPA: type II toxin-antitoxin system VapC family toxin [Ktedonobacterales bacterium]|nr:type II toxin-antitoxin system VapC family toxin [Ktedonobacterales bacterium]
MKRYLLDNAVVVAYMKGRAGAMRLVQPWIVADEATTSLVVYGEAIEYIRGEPDFSDRRATLRIVLQQVTPLRLSYAILERYADLRRAMRPPHGPGLIGDVDTLIAATALEHKLTVVTLDGDFMRVPGLQAMHLDRAALM